MGVFPRPFHLRGGRRRAVHLHTVEVVLQAAVPAGRRHETGIRLRGDGHRRGGKPCRRGTVPGRPAGNVAERGVTGDIRRNVCQHPHLPGRLVTRGRIDVDGRLDQIRRLEVGHFPPPHVQID